jgi:hypothetical protein
VRDEFWHARLESSRPGEKLEQLNAQEKHDERSLLQFPLNAHHTTGAVDSLHTEHSLLRWLLDGFLLRLRRRLSR